MGNQVTILALPWLVLQLTQSPFQLGIVGALEFGKKPFQLDNRVAVWALTNTASLNKGKPALKLTEKVRN